MLKKLIYKKRLFKKLILSKLNFITNSVKFIFLKNLNKITIYFLRKNKTFIKSKYSRTRQWSKVIVYFGLWYGILSVWFMMLHAYKFIFVLAFAWWFPALLIVFALLRSFKKYFFFFKKINFIPFWLSLELGFWRH